MLVLEELLAMFGQSRRLGFQNGIFVQKYVYELLIVDELFKVLLELNLLIGQLQIWCLSDLAHAINYKVLL